MNQLITLYLTNLVFILLLLQHFHWIKGKILTWLSHNIIYFLFLFNYSLVKKDLCV